MSTIPRTMTPRLLLPLVTLSLLFACGTNAPEQVASEVGVDRVVKEVIISSGTPVTMADLSIEGMGCEMMCGGSIKKALAALGVEGTEIKMNEAEGPDHAIVTYDDKKITDAQMIEAVQKLHDGQYKVVAVSITKEVIGKSASKGQDKTAEVDGEVSVLSPREVVLPSILMLLSRILRN